MARVLFAGAAYFAIVFVFAFAFGTIRTLLVEPRWGETWAVAAEIPLLIAVIVLAARWAVRRFRPFQHWSQLLCVGAFALVLQQGAEFALVFASGESAAEHIAYLGTLAGRLYLSALVVFIFAPLAVWRKA
jgi:hypothetical protein